MPKFSGQSFAAKWKKRTAGAATDFTDGVRDTRKNPMQLAVAKKDKWWNKLQEARDSGKWEQNTAAVSPEEWKQATIEKGGRNFTTGVNAAEAKMARFGDQLGQFLDSHMARIDAMDDSTEAGREAKMLENARGMKQFRFKRGLR